MAVRLHVAPAPESSESERATKPIRVVLADDHVLMRRSLRLLLDGEADVEVVAEASDHSAAERQCTATARTCWCSTCA